MDLYTNYVIIEILHRILQILSRPLSCKWWGRPIGPHVIYFTSDR